jgi:nucleotidyltransferase substrate binding protein (TIGR01987 family)
MKLDLSSLRKAVSSLERTLKVAADAKFMEGLSDDQSDAVRAGAIQNFEFTYELCWKFMKRWLESNLGSSHVEGVARRELFRLAAESKLISDVDKWMEYHDARNETSHTYDEETAADVFGTAGEFARDAKMFLKALEAKND